MRRTRVSPRARSHRRAVVGARRRDGRRFPIHLSEREDPLALRLSRDAEARREQDDEFIRGEDLFLGERPFPQHGAKEVSDEPEDLEGTPEPPPTPEERERSGEDF